MKASVYPRGANPRVDRHIQRKSLHYCREQVEVYGTADWVDPSDPAQGIICRELLHFGEKMATAVSATPEEIAKLTHGRMKSALPPAEVSGCKFVPPPTQRNETLPRLQIEELPVAVQNWDWVTA